MNISEEAEDIIARLFPVEMTKCSSVTAFTRDDMQEVARKAEEFLRYPCITPRWNDFMDNMVLLDCGTKENAEKVYRALKGGISELLKDEV